ncbi:MAG: hypothetical protein IKK60_00230 [Clostridia bacterium]|nr:hypothetical protein [Clostridia bacterium]
MRNRALVLHHDFIDMFYLHTDEEIGQLIRAAFKYDISDNATDFEDRMMRASFLRIMDFIDKNKRKYEEACERREAAAERYRIKRALDGRDSEY